MWRWWWSPRNYKGLVDSKLWGGIASVPPGLTPMIRVNMVNIACWVCKSVHMLIMYPWLPKQICYYILTSVNQVLINTKYKRKKHMISDYSFQMWKIVISNSILCCSLIQGLFWFLVIKWMQGCQLLLILQKTSWFSGKINQSGYTNLTTFLILEIFCPLNYMWYNKSSWLVKRIFLIARCLCWQLCGCHVMNGRRW